MMALSNNNLGNYWTSSGPYDEIFYYIRNNVDAVRDDLAVMISGGSVPARVREYAATSQELKTKEEILSAMVVYGFLSYENGEVSIPNKELMDQFADMIKKENSFVDFIFYPELPPASTGIILELKADHSPQEAIAQIKQKNYILRFTGKMVQEWRKPHRILLVGIGYDKKTKKHRCEVEEVLRTE